MQRHPWFTVLTLAWLAIPTVALAWDGPEVPEEALTAVPQEVRDGWAEQEQRIDEMTREIEAAQVAMEESGDEPDELDTAREDLRTARDEASEVRAQARSQLEVARHERDAARLERDAARQQKKIAKGRLKLARSGGDRTDIIAAKAEVADAKAEVAAAKDDVRQAKRSYALVAKETDQRRQGAGEAVATAKQEKAEAADALELDQVGADLAEAELALLVAERDVALAELELEQAQAAVDTGYPLEIAPFGSALDEARAAESEARQALRQADEIEV